MAAAPSAATTFMVDFNAFSEGQYLNGSVVDLAPGLTAHVSSSRTFDGETNVARICDTQSVAAAGCAKNDPDLLSPFNNVNGGGAKNLQNVLIIQNRNKTVEVDDDPNGGTITFSNFIYSGGGPLILDRLDFADTTDNPDGGKLFLNGSSDAFETGDPPRSIFGGGDRRFETVFVGEAITSFAVRFGGSGAVDNIGLSTTPVPLPMAGWMLLAALGVTGVAARRRTA